MRNEQSQFASASAAQRGPVVDLLHAAETRAACVEAQLLVLQAHLRATEAAQEVFKRFIREARAR